MEYLGLLPAEFSWVTVVFVIIFATLFNLDYFFKVLKNGADAIKYVNDTFKSNSKK